MPESWYTEYSWFECGCRLIPMTYLPVSTCSICGYDFIYVEAPSDGKAKTYPFS